MHFIDLNLGKVLCCSTRKRRKTKLYNDEMVERRTFKSISVQQASEADVGDSQIA